MHGTIVVKDSVLREHPWVARSLFDAFSAARVSGWRTARHRHPAPTRSIARCAHRRRRSPAVRHRRTSPPFEALESHAFKQRLIPRRMPVDELFVELRSDVRKERHAWSHRRHPSPHRLARYDALSGHAAVRRADRTGRRNEKPATRT